MDPIIKSVSEQLGVSPKRAKKIIEKVKKFMKTCEDQLKENPFDRTVEEMTEEDILLARTMFAEMGIEYTPQELNEAVELIIHMRAMIRGC